MPSFDAIADVSRTLQVILTDALVTVDPNQPPQVQIHDLDPPPAGNPPVLTLFLYEICEDATLRNRPEVATLGVDNRYATTKPPLPLVLRYLVTAWGGNPTTEQQMLGRVLQVLYDGQILRPHQLQGRLAESPDGIAVTLATLSLEERTRVWWSIQQPYRLSLNYEARVIDIDAEAVSHTSPVSRRILTFQDAEGTP